SGRRGAGGPPRFRRPRGGPVRPKGARSTRARAGPDPTNARSRRTLGMAARIILLVGTKRGLFRIESDASRERWTVSEPFLVGREVYHAFLDPRDGKTAWAASDHAVWGAHVHRSDDRGREWTVLETAPHHADERGLKAIWHLAPGHTTQPDTLYAGIEPAGLFVSRDRGGSWESVRGLNDHPTRDTWQPAGGGLALGSIVVDPRT